MLKRLVYNYKRSIYKKFVFIIIIALLLASTISSIVMIKFVDEYLVSKQVRDMKQAADNINTLALDYYMSDEYKNGTQVGKNWIMLRNRVDIYSEVWKSNVFVTDVSGRILVSSPAIPTINNSGQYGFLADNILSKLNYKDGGYYFADENQYKNCFYTSDFIIDKTNFYGMYDWSGSPWLTVSKKLDYSQNGESVPFGTVSLSTDIPEIKSARSNVVQYFIYSTILGSIIIGTILFIFTAKISKALKDLRLSANRLASGEFPDKLDIKSNDEIGDVVESFNKMTSALSNLDTVRNDFVANVSHELRTPMTSIRGFVEAILDGTIPVEKQTYYLEIVRNETTRMNNMINELLDLAKLQADKQVLNYTQFDINEVISICIKNLNILFSEKNIDVKTKFDSNLEMVKADKGTIERVLINLLHNAIKFTKIEGQISISTQRIKDKVEITVSDNGIGMSLDEQTMIFDRFYKTDKSRSEDKKGTGLGLAIVKKIISAHGQDIRVESMPNEGSKFIFTLNR